MCKIYFAAHVSKYAPHGNSHSQSDLDMFGNRWPHIHRNIMDASCIILLDKIMMRRNYNDTLSLGYSDGKTPPARPEDAGVEAYRDAQSTPRSRGRSPVQRKPVLRSQRSSPSSLRDAAAAQCSRDINSGCGCRFWGLSPHLLSGTSGLQSGWPGRLVAQSAWPKGWTQGDDRSSRLHSKLEGDRTWVDHRPVRAGRPGALWSYPPPPKSRAGFGAKQKKTSQPDLKLPLPTGAAAAYEALRAHLVNPADQLGAAAGRVVLLRHGMLAFACARCQPPSPSSASLYPLAPSPVPSAVAIELVQLMAGLILSRGKDSCYA